VLSRIDADITGLIELENNPTESPQDLVNGLNGISAAGSFDYINTGTIGSDAIKVVIIYQPGSVTPAGLFKILDDSVDPTFNQDFNRPSLAQKLKENATGERFTVIVNHFKLKGSSCAAPPENDPDTGYGQENCNLTRLNAAKALINWLASDPTSSGDPDLLIIGDLNAYAKKDPVGWIKSAGYTDLVNRYGSLKSYTFSSGGQWEYLDNALASSTLSAKVTGATVWPINSDDPGVLDYNEEFKSGGQIISLYNSDPYRSSDHDLVIVRLDLSEGLLPYAKTPVKLHSSGLM
jgi:predicted extracellular nuclease